MQISKKLSLYTFALLGVLLLLNSCKKEYETIQSIDEAKIQAYIKQNNLTMTKDPSGFYYQVLTQGTGAPLAYKDSVFYNLEVKSLSGQSYISASAYNNDGTYLGYLNPSSYRTALLGVKRGSKVRIILPSYLAYGKNGYGTVPSNEVIVSDITTYAQATQWQIDDARILSFLSANNITAVKSPLRVYYKVQEAGTGISIDISSTLTLKYTGRLLNGTVFDQTSGTNYLVSQLSSLIKGWGVLLGMQKGAKIRIFVPSDLAYGLSGQTDSYTGKTTIPASSILDFDIEVIDVTN